MWRQHRDSSGEPTLIHTQRAGIWRIAAVTLANGADNIGIYVPVFATIGVAGTAAYMVVFLIAVALWCAFGWFLATRPIVATMLTHRGHLVLPAVLIGLGRLILIEGGAFGL